MMLDNDDVGKVLASADNDGADTHGDQSSLTVLAECNSLQRVWVQVIEGYGGELYGGQPYTMFSAVLINPL